MEGEKKLEAIKVTDNRFLGFLSPGVERLAKRIDDPTIAYETLWTYFCNTIQYGGNSFEFWVVWDGDKIYGYAHFFVKPLPQRGVACCDYLNTCRNRRKVTQMLMDEFIKFGKRSRCALYEGSALSNKEFQVIKNRAKQAGYEIKPTGKITFLGSKI
jgi:hypothetical protein